MRRLVYTVLLYLLIGCDSAGVSTQDVAPKLPVVLAEFQSKACVTPSNETSVTYENEAATQLDLDLRSVLADKDEGSLPEVTGFAEVCNPRAQLGKKLFFYKGLSGSGEVACASCHHPKLMGGDGLSLPVGVGALEPEVLGPGRSHNIAEAVRDSKADGAPNVARHSPSTFNTALYKKALFWDGRIFKKESGIVTPDSLVLGDIDVTAQATLLATQALFPTTSIEEMKGHVFLPGKSNQFVKQALLQRLMDGDFGHTFWRNQFQDAYALSPQLPIEETITLDRISDALAAYQESQVFTDNNWFKYLQGDNGAISNLAKQGALNFYRTGAEGGFNCAACHAGGNFSDENFHNAAFPQLGRGKGAQNADLGRFLATKEDADLYKFRTPSLLNAALTAPYGHAGSFASLQDTLRYHLSPLTEYTEYDFELNSLPQFEGKLYQYGNAQSNTKIAAGALGRQRLSDASFDFVFKHNPSDLDINSLLAFIETLSDSCLLAVKSGEDACIDAWLPGVNEFPQQLEAAFSTFSSAPGGWFSPEKITQLPQITDGMPAVNSAIDECAYDAAESAGRFTFIEKSEATGLNVDVPKVDFMDINYDDFLTIDILNSIEYPGLVIAEDFDADGYTDLILPTGFGTAPKVMIYNSALKIYQDKTIKWGLSSWDKKLLSGGGVADLDGDGDLDLVLTGRVLKADGTLTGSGYMNIYRQDDGGWLQVLQSGLTTSPTYSVSFADFNSDGLLDLFASSWNMVQGTIEQFVWENKGGLLFSGAGVESGIIRNMPAKDFTFTPINVDLNGNMYPDLVMIADFKNTIGLFNAGNSQYVAAVVGQEPLRFSDENGMGGAAADFDNDGDIDVFVTSIYRPLDNDVAFPGTGNRLYVNQGNGALLDTSDESGVRDGGWGWGACARDFNNDGYEDIFHTNGFGGVVAQVPIAQENSFSPYLEDSSRLFISNGDGTFTDRAQELGIDDKGQGRGVACYDYDKDGDIDILVSQNYGRPKLYENQLNGASKYIEVQLVDEKASNTRAIGAKISLTNDNLTVPQLQYREVQANSSFISQSPSAQHFGLGDADGRYSLEIIWPRPILEKSIIPNVQANQCLKITRPN